MTDTTFKKMAGTSAVFVKSDLSTAAPIERDGIEWTDKDLRLDKLKQGERKASMANALALEGLEDYNPPSSGDIRTIDSMNLDFVYSTDIRAWVQI